MPPLKGSRTESHLKAAFAAAAQANRRYLYFAQQADVEGYRDVAAVFRATADGATGHAFGHLEFLEASGDPTTGLPLGDTVHHLRSAIASESLQHTGLYPGMAAAAREENFTEIAEWFESLAKADGAHAVRLAQALDDLGA